MGYIDPSSDVRLFTGLSDSDITSADLTTLVEYATVQLNRDINYIVNDEKVDYISAEKRNKMDGSNTIYYAKLIDKTTNRFGDYNNDGEVNASDVIAYTIDGSGDRTVYTVSSMDNAEIGKFTLSSAVPASEQLYIHYSVAPVNESAPDNLIKMACVQLAAALAFTRIDAKKISKYKVGKISITQQSQGFDIFYNQYQRTVSKINAKMDSIDEIE